MSGAVQRAGPVVMVAVVCVGAFTAQVRADEDAGDGVMSPERPAGTSGATQLRAALRRYAHEPTVSEVVQAARKAARAEPDEVRAAARRARRRGWVPELDVGVRHGQQRDRSERQGVTGDRTQLSSDDELAFDASLTFDLADIVFSRREVQLLRERRALREERNERTETVVHLYFERRRLQLERDLVGRESLERVVRIAEIEALLNAFTAGAFGRMMDRDAVGGARGR